ncbi:MAG TPA: TetR family transcriptional regulator [Nocardioidaceae bacterium]|nr:TetR family transcriptional regulator [Nocardioidaceae bacterium]
MEATSIAQTRRERKERTRQAILDAALRLLDEEAFGQLSLRQIAREVGMVPTAFYRHFSSLEELGLTLVDESFSTLREMIRAARDDMGAYESVIRRSVQVLVDHVHAHRSHFSFVARERFGGNAAVRGAIHRELELFSHELATDLTRLPNLRSWRPEDMQMLSDLIVNAMVSTAMLLLTVEDPEDERRLVRDARKQLRLIVVGISGWQPR